MPNCEGNKTFVEWFLKGQMDCRNGIPHKDLSPEYTRGYSAQYAAGESQSANQQWFEDFMKGKVKI